MSDTQRRLVFAIFLYTCIEGLVVNFFYPNPLAYLPKDVMIAFLYASQFLNGAGGNGAAQRVLIAYVVFFFVHLLFLAIPTPITGVGIAVAFKQRLFYIPLLLAGYHYVRGDMDVARLLRLMAWSSIPVSLFGIFLFFAGPHALAQMGAGYSHAFFSTAGETGGTFYRVPGTFNSPGQYGTYLFSVGVMLVGFLLVKDLAPKDRRMLLIALGCVVPAMLVSGSRAPMLVFLLLGGLTALLSRDLSRAGVVAAIGYVILVGSLNYLGTSVTERFASINSAENVSRATGTLFGQLWITQVVNHPLGEGLGLATNGARHFGPRGSVRLVESYLGIVGTEMGLLGVMAFLLIGWMILSVLIPARGWMRRAPSRPIWTAGFLLVVSNVLLTTNATALDSIPMNLYFWFFVGMLIRMAELERARLTWQASGGPMPSPGDAQTAA